MTKRSTGYSGSGTGSRPRDYSSVTWNRFQQRHAQSVRKLLDELREYEEQRNVFRVQEQAESLALEWLRRYWKFAKPSSRTSSRTRSVKSGPRTSSNT